MIKLYKCDIDVELEKGLKILDPKDAYRWALICSEHTLNIFNIKNNHQIDLALQTINNNLDNVENETAKQISNLINNEAENLKTQNISLYLMFKALASTVATLYSKKHAVYSAIYSASAIYYKTKNKELVENEKLYQLEKLNKFLIMYEE